MAKNEKDKQTNNSTHDTTQKTEKQHEPHQKQGVIAGAPEEQADPAPHVAPVVLLML